MTALLLPLSLH